MTLLRNQINLIYIMFVLVSRLNTRYMQKHLFPAAGKLATLLLMALLFSGCQTVTTKNTAATANAPAAQEKQQDALPPRAPVPAEAGRKGGIGPKDSQPPVQQNCRRAGLFQAPAGPDHAGMAPGALLGRLRNSLPHDQCSASGRVLLVPHLVHHGLHEVGR